MQVAQDRDTFSHKDLLNGKDLREENLKKKLTNLFKVYSSDIGITNLWKMLPRRVIKAYTVQLIQKFLK